MKLGHIMLNTKNILLKSKFHLMAPRFFALCSSKCVIFGFVRIWNFALMRASVSPRHISNFTYGAI